MDKKNSVQIIGMDIGRGYVKAYSEYNNVERECLFKSVVGLGRDMEFNNYKKPLYNTIDGEDFFVGILAEQEADNPIQNLKDDKTTPTVQKLLYTALNQLSISDNVKIMLGVPNKLFRKSILEEVQNCYKNKTVTIKDNITNAYKTITIQDISIYREGDAALLWHVKDRDESNNENDLAMVTVGFRTTEFSYYTKDMKYVDKFSKTMELGNKTALEYVQRKVLDITESSKTLSEIDSSDRYDDMKKIAYSNLSESVEQEIENAWINKNEMDVFVAGGTALNLNLIDHEVVEDAQMLTARGLWLVGTKRFK